MSDIHTEEDITTLVHSFYARVRADEILSPNFDEVIKDDWDKHLQKMCDFWGTLLLYTRKYVGDPMSKHLPLPLEKAHFERWLALFNDTIDNLFEGTNAAEAKRRAANIARIMQNFSPFASSEK